MNTRKYYAVQFWSSKSTTTGQPNKKTGRLSKACSTGIFKSKAARDLWVEEGKTTPDMRGNCREAVTKKELRELNLGLTTEQFNEHLEMLVPFEDYE